MRLGRRDLILASLPVWLAPVLPALSQTVVTTPQDHAVTLRAFVDTLLPEDEFSPAASALGVDAEILGLVESSEMFARLFVMVADWLDQIGPVPFADLPDEDRTLALAYMERADPDVLEGRFYQLIRLLALEFFYARPEALAGLNLDVAPQPAGYPPPWD